jgi:hypothetical protein
MGERGKLKKEKGERRKETYLVPLTGGVRGG